MGTQMAAAERSREIEANYAAFLKRLPEISQTHSGKFAVMRHGEIVDFFDTIGDAARFVGKMYPDGQFSIQEVTQRSANLGFYSYAMHQPSV